MTPQTKPDNGLTNLSKYDCQGISNEKYHFLDNCPSSPNAKPPLKKQIIGGKRGAELRVEEKFGFSRSFSLLA